MPVANNINELKQMLQKRLSDAMEVTRNKSLTDMQEEVASFYTQGKPFLYTRTGNLKRSPRVTDLTVSDDKASFEAYLYRDDPGVYDNFNRTIFLINGFSSYFSPLQVFTAAENHTSGVLGKPGFWRRSLKRIEKDFNDTIRTFFS